MTKARNTIFFFINKKKDIFRARDWIVLCLTKLTTFQRLLHHPKIQDMMMDHLMKDLAAYEEDYEEESPLTRGERIQKPLPPGFIPPELLAHWDVDWEALARTHDDADDDEDDLDFEEIFDELM